MQEPVEPILIFTWGNPSRGDDALGPRMYELLEEEAFDGVDILTDFQLQIEHTVDMQNCDRILFIDASITAKAPFEFYRLKPGQDDSYTTHAMSPESLLATYEKVNKQAPPPAFMLSIRGYDFGLGLPVSDRASANLADALTFLRQLVSVHSTDGWEGLVSS